MNLRQTLSGSWNNVSVSEKSNFPNYVQKPIEIYAYIDPTCPKCWSLEPYLKKLSVEYGRFFTIRPIIYNNPSVLKEKLDHKRNLKVIFNDSVNQRSMKYNKSSLDNDLTNSPLIASIAIKAAELQGKSAGRNFLRKIQELFFLKKQDIFNESALMQSAIEAKIDVQEFRNDLFSNSAKKALQCDLKLSKEMEVESTPTLVFFNQNTEDEGIKISGLYPYNIYVLVLSKMLQFAPIPTQKPPLEDFVAHYKLVANKDISVVYDWTLSKTNREMKKLKLKQKVIKKPAKNGPFWKYVKEKV